MTSVDYDIIIFALPRWDGLYSSTAYSLAKQLSRHTRVFYIDNPFTYKDFIANRKSPQISRRKEALLHGRNYSIQPEPELKNLVAVTPELTWPINWLPKGKLYDRLSRVNDRIVFRVISALMRDFQIRKFVFINSFNPLFGRYFPLTFNPLMSIYHCVDDISKSRYVSKHGTYLEKEAITRADLTLVTSMELKRLKAGYAKKLHYHPNAADVELFQRALSEDIPRPSELQSIPPTKKILLYMGNICHRLDYSLLTKIATTNKDAVLVMVGPQTNDEYKKIGLDRLYNVLFTGRKNLSELPAFVRHSDCCLIPFVCNSLTRSIYPLKINEYLSGGKPVVTTKFSEDITNFEHVAYLSSSHDHFLENIERALVENSDFKSRERVQHAAVNNWASRALELLNLINSSLKAI